MTRFELAKSIDHTVLAPDANIEDVKRACREAKEWDFATVFVSPTNLEIVIEELSGSSIKTGTVVGFPLGNTLAEVKVYETRNYLDKGAQEIDMVMNFGALKSGKLDLVLSDISMVVNEVRKAGLYGRKSAIIIKVIIETCYLNKKEKMIAAEIVKKAGADFIKTSTGFGPAGAEVKDVELLFRAIGHELGIKASGGIRHFSEAQAMIDAGATRIGTSASVQIMEEFISMEKDKKKKRKSMAEKK